MTLDSSSISPLWHHSHIQNLHYDITVTFQISIMTSQSHSKSPLWHHCHLPSLHYNIIVPLPIYDTSHDLTSSLWHKSSSWHSLSKVWVTITFLYSIKAFPFPILIWPLPSPYTHLIANSIYYSQQQITWFVYQMSTFIFCWQILSIQTLIHQPPS